MVDFTFINMNLIPVFLKKIFNLLFTIRIYDKPRTVDKGLMGKQLAVESEMIFALFNSNREWLIALIIKAI